MSPEIEIKAQQAGKVYEHLKRLAAAQGLTVMSIKEAERNEQILEGMKRARKVIDAFNVINGDLDNVIIRLKEFTMKAYGTEESRMLELLEELKQLKIEKLEFRKGNQYDNTVIG